MGCDVSSTGDTTRPALRWPTDRSMCERPKGRSSSSLPSSRYEPLTGTIGIGHTRWATHGEPSDLNAHPHTDPTGEFVVVHNGIIENFQTLREELEAGGAVLTSQTDTEILAHLIAEEYDGDLACGSAARRRARRRCLRTGRDDETRAPQDRGRPQDQPAGDWPRRGRDLPRLRHPGPASPHSRLPHHRRR